jgi:hypothetical protein
MNQLPLPIKPIMSIDNLTLAHFRHFNSLFTNLPAYKALHLSRTLYKSTLFMQNKPNVKDAQINVNSYMKSKYEKLDTWLSGKNKANSNPNKPNLRKAKMNVNSFIIKDYRINDDFTVRINKPNFQNGKNDRKLNFNKGLQKKRLFSSPKNKPKTNPILSAAGGFKKGQNPLPKNLATPSIIYSVDIPLMESTAMV